MFDISVLLVLFVLGTIYVVAETLTISGIAPYEVKDLREDFAGVDQFLLPKVIAAARPWRHVLRITPIVLANTLWAFFLVYGLRLEADGWLVGSLGCIVVLEWLGIVVVRRINARKYRSDIEECKRLTHPDNLRLLGCLQDRSPQNPYAINPDDQVSMRPFRAGHFVRGGRLITVVTVNERVQLFLPLAFYGPRPVEETVVPVVVFYQSWSKSGLVRDPDCQQAIGVYVGFRVNPESVVEPDVSMDEAVAIGRAIADNSEGL